MLIINAEQCTGCQICVNFCSFFHEQAIWPARARIWILSDNDDGPFTPNHCRQCEDAPCAEVCPVEAITLDEQTGAWLVDDATCIGCALCVEACQYDAIFVDDALDKAIKCDLCGGTPMCAKNCPMGAITTQVSDR